MTNLWYVEILTNKLMKNFSRTKKYQFKTSCLFSKGKSIWPLKESRKKRESLILIFSRCSRWSILAFLLPKFFSTKIFSFMIYILFYINWSVVFSNLSFKQNLKDHMEKQELKNRYPALKTCEQSKESNRF